VHFTLHRCIPKYFWSVSVYPGYLDDTTDPIVEALKPLCIYMHVGERDGDWLRAMKQQSDMFRRKGYSSVLIVEENQGATWISGRKTRSISSKFHNKTVVVTNCGRLCLYRKKINLSTCLAGQAVGIKEVDEGIWLVSFMDYDLGYIDLEEKTLQPLSNTFGPKVLPMS